LCLSACAAFAQEESSDSAPPTAKLEINLDARGGASVAAKVFEGSATSSLASVISQTIDCAFDNPHESKIDGEWKFAAKCAGAFRKRGLLVGGQIRFAPLSEALKALGVESLDVVIRHPRTGFSRFTDNGWTLETTAQSLEYTKKLALSGPPPLVRLAFGYRLVNFFPISLLLFPIALTMVMRWAALRARNTDPVVVWFTYWRLFGWVITGTWLLWVQGSTVLDCNALARFLMNGSSKSVLLQLAFYVVPPILVQFICTVASGAVLARVSGERWVLPVSLKHAFWHEPVTIWPLLCLLAGVASLTLFSEVVLGLACLAVAFASYVFLVWLWMRLQNLSRYELPAGDLRSRILELAQQAGVKLAGIYLLPAAEGRLAGPYMIRRRRLFVSDAMLRLLRKRETEVVLAREFVHLRRHHRDIIIALAVLALPLIYRFANLPSVAGIPWAVRGPLLVWLTPVLLYLLWRRFDRVAETEAAGLTGDTGALVDAMPRLAQFNVIGLYWRRFERRFFPNGSQRDWQQELQVLPVANRESLVGAPSGGPKQFVSAD
jgi:Zn-dependent protease with chaperone function